MSFEDIAQRMKDRRSTTHIGGIPGLALGEDLPELSNPPTPVVPVAPARRTALLVAAYLVLSLGTLIALAGTFVLLAWYRETQGMHRALVMVIAIGVAVVVTSTKMFERVAATQPLPDARLHN